jgi:IS5 family transposase
LADNGFAHDEQIDELERRHLEVLVATGRSAQREYDFRPPKPAVPDAAHPKPWVKRMKARLQSDRGRALYRLRQQTVEPVFGIIKQVMGFRRFMLRGLDKVSGEWQLVCLAYNCKRLHRLVKAT